MHGLGGVWIHREAGEKQFFRALEEINLSLALPQQDNHLVHQTNSIAPFTLPQLFPVCNFSERIEIFQDQAVRHEVEMFTV